MIQLALTLAELHQLQQWLTDSLPTQPAQQGQTAVLHALLTKLAAADETTHQRHCPVCQQDFTQEERGRTGCYCSAACKQKAYRLRRQTARKQFGPPRKP